MSQAPSQESDPGAGQDAPSGSASGQDASREAERMQIFRREALEHLAGSHHEAHILQITPAWIHRAYWLLMAVCGFALVYTVVGHVREYASGTALIQAEGRIDVTARVAGTVESVDVHPGQRVAAGQVLARLYSGEEAAGLRRIEEELELQLVRTLRDPGDASARSALTSLRAERDLALARLEERAIRAPRAGLVSDVRIRRSQQLQPGDAVLSLIGDDAGFRVVAMLPGQYRPLLRRGMPLRLELVGYPYAYQTVPIEAVSDEVVGPAEVRRYLGPAAADTVTPQGPLVLVEARLPSRSFEAQGRRLGYYEGMQAQAEVPVRSESILIALIPGLRAITGDHGDGL